jgi:hypothetical protein
MQTEVPVGSGIKKLSELISKDRPEEKKTYSQAIKTADSFESSVEFTNLIGTNPLVSIAFGIYQFGNRLNERILIGSLLL